MTNNKGKLTLETWSIERVLATLNSDNPRIITSKQLQDLRNNIREFGLVLPVVINIRTNRLVGGHQRVKAAQLEGLSEIQVSLVDLSEEDELLLSLALNKISGKWDYQVLEEVLTELAQTDAIGASGFSESELIDIMADYEEEPEESFEEFAQRFSARRSQDYVVFRSSKLIFSCAKQQYEALVKRLYEDVGVDDVAASIRFFQLIGL